MLGRRTILDMPSKFITNNIGEKMNELFMPYSIIFIHSFGTGVENE
jgi:hypothetical protein